MYDIRMSQVKTHSAGCHCGEIRFDVELDLTSPASRCNCTPCVKWSWFVRGPHA